MRTVTFLSLTIGMIAVNGCSNGSLPTSTSTSKAPYARSNVTSVVPPDTSEELSDFDPKLTLEWPGTPIISCGRQGAGTVAETTIYNAGITQTDPVTRFSVQIFQSTAQALEGFDPKATLSESALDSDDEALSRREFEHGPNKYPAIDVTAKSGDSFARRVIVVAGTRSYRIEVLSTRQERLSEDDISKFLDSIKIQD